MENTTTTKPLPRINGRFSPKPKTSGFHELPMDAIHANYNQPRKIFDEGALDELASSIEQFGQLQPIKVRPDGDDKYMIVVGERRWRAHQLLGKTTIQATITEMSDDDMADAAIVENIQRKDITPLEEARAYRMRLELGGLTVEQLAKRLGFKQPWRIQERLNLLNLTPDFQEALAKGVLTPSQAQEMSRLSPSLQIILFNAIRNGKCNTYAELRAVTQSLLEADKQGGPAKEKTPSDERLNGLHTLETKIDQICKLAEKGFDSSEVARLCPIDSNRADAMADKLEQLESALRSVRLSLRAASAASAACI